MAEDKQITTRKVFVAYFLTMGCCLAGLVTIAISDAFDLSLIWCLIPLSVAGMLGFYMCFISVKAIWNAP